MVLAMAMGVGQYVFVTFTSAEAEETGVVSNEGDSCAHTV